MQLRKMLILFFSTLAIPYLLFAEDSGSKKDPCRDCPFPKTFQFLGGSEGKVLDLKLKNGSILYNVTSLERTLSDFQGNWEQSIIVKYLRDGRCHDTLFLTSQVSHLKIGNIGSTGQPLILPIRPARYFICQQGTIGLPESFLEITANVGYGGSYDNPNNRSVGFGSIFGGIEFLYNPIGDFFGKRTTLSIGGGAFVEGSRIRLPLQLQMRWRIFGDQRIEEQFIFVPNSCQFATPGDKPISPLDENNEQESAQCKEIQKEYTEYDSTAYYLRKKIVHTDIFRPFIFIEGGMIFNGFSEGAGKDPSINPGDYGQYLLGAGLGLPIGDRWTISLGYRFLRLNLRTICENCNNLYVLNTNKAHTLLLKAGWRMNW